MLPMVLSIIKNLTRKNLNGFLFNTSDAHSNEYIGPADEILKEVTGFTGSNGLALAMKNRGYLWTDSRYHIQASKELDQSYWTLIKGTEDFYAIVKSNSYRIGVDKRFFSNNEYTSLKKHLKGVKIVGDQEFVDEVWKNRPIRKFNEFINLEEIYFMDVVDFEKLGQALKQENNIIKKDTNVSGSYRRDKFKILRKKMKDNDVFIITSLDEIAWLFNLRGSDIPFNPVFYSYVILTNDEITLFTNAKIKIDEVIFKEYNKFEDSLKEISRKKVLVSSSCNVLIFDVLKDNKNEIKESNLINELKSVKNEIEILGFKFAHVFDAICLSQLFESIDNLLNNERPPNKVLTEIKISEMLLDFKKEIKGFVSPSFETISAYAENGAIVHHRGGLKEVKRDNLFLIDSGSQYYFGTTDVTRTLCFGEPTEQQRKDFTTVLKGQLNAMRQKLKKTYGGGYLDAITRAPIWNELRDYDHGTGHGVGHFLNVHESPPSVSSSGPKFQENNVFSIEPGIYKENEYGIRIEDLVVVKNFNSEYIFFENMTLAPLQRKMIDVDLLNDEEVSYINEFNLRARSVIQIFIKERDLGFKFLMENTEPLIKNK